MLVWAGVIVIAQVHFINEPNTAKAHCVWTPQNIFENYFLCKRISLIFQEVVNQDTIYVFSLLLLTPFCENCHEKALGVKMISN